ncbi:Uncharacterised protein [Vibrio cholerae]|nr:Uncharacterised protein [Vibrio cholerae]
MACLQTNRFGVNPLNCATHNLEDLLLFWRQLTSHRWRCRLLRLVCRKGL